MISLLPEYGVGIELSRRSLRAVAAKTLFGKIQIVDHLEIDHLDTLSAAECAATYHAFLKRNGLEAPWTVVAIPRESFLYREVKLPAAVLGELRSVMELQIDSLHPFGEEPVVWDCAASVAAKEREQRAMASSKASQSAALVTAAVARSSVIESLTEWFEERTIPVSHFAPSPLLLRNVAAGTAVDEGSLKVPVAIAYLRDTVWELLGIAADGASSTRQVEIEEHDRDRALRALSQETERLLAELRVDGSAQPELLMGGLEQPDDDLFAELRRVVGERAAVKSLPPRALAEAAARMAVSGQQRTAVNLLPAERRRFVPSVSMVPTYALAGIVMLLCVAMVVRPTLQDWLYSRRLGNEIESLQPRIAEIESIRGRERQTYNQLLRLISIRSAAGIPLAVLEDLTQALPNDAWLQSVQMEGNALTISGSASSASGVLQAISQAQTLESPQFLSAISRSNAGEESFRIGARLKVGMQ